MAVKQKHPDIQAVSSGAIKSNYQRLRVENVCSRLGLISLAYMWEQDQATLLQSIVSGTIDNPDCQCFLFSIYYSGTKVVLSGHSHVSL